MWYKAKKLILHVYKLPRQGMYKVKGGGRKENEGGDRASSGRGFESKKEMSPIINHECRILQKTSLYHIDEFLQDTSRRRLFFCTFSKLLMQEFGYSLTWKMVPISS